MEKKITLTFTAGLLFVVSVAAQSPKAPPPAASAGLLNDWLREQNSAFASWDLGGQIRARFESKSGYAVPGVAGAVDFAKTTPDNDYWLVREKLHVGWKPVDWLNLYAEARDSSSWNDKRVPETEEDVFDLHQAYVSLGNAKKFPVTAKIGRQELIYGDERLLGASDWGNLGRVFDAAKLRYENNSLSVDFFAGRVVIPRDDRFNTANDYDWLSGVYASTKTLIPKQETQLYFLARNVSQKSPSAFPATPPALVAPATARDIYTLGLRFKSLPGQFGGWDYDAELAGQFGNFYDAALTNRLDQQALAAHVAGGYTWKDASWSPRVGLEYNYSSGDSDSNDGKHETFDNLFPTNHKFYGFMDFASWQNIHDVRLTTSAKPLKGLTLTADYHLFWLADTADYFYGVTGAARKTGGYGLKPANANFVGSELDLVASYQIKTCGVAQVGYGHFFRGGYVKDSLAASKDADWFYLQAVFNF